MATNDAIVLQEYLNLQHQDYGADRGLMAAVPWKSE